MGGPPKFISLGVCESYGIRLTSLVRFIVSWSGLYAYCRDRFSVGIYGGPRVGCIGVYRVESFGELRLH